MSAAKQLSWLDAPAPAPAPPAPCAAEVPIAADASLDDPAAIALEIVAELGTARREIAALAAELAPRVPDLGDRIMAVMSRQIARADEDTLELRKLHAEILRCPLEELDARVAAEQAKEKAEREVFKAARPAPARTSAKAARGSRSEQRAPEAPPTARLSDRERELLRNLRVEGQLAVYLPEEHIADWALLKRIMVSLGGKWKTGGKKAKGGFAFPEDVDAREQVRLALETGEILDPRAAGFFPTPAPLADRIVALAEVRPRDRVLEPSAGRGAIAQAVLRAEPTARVICVEFLPDNVKALRAAGFSVIEKDFLSVDPKDRDNGSEPEFNGSNDVVVMNPPFAKAADVAHVKHALEFMNHKASLVAIMSAGVLYRDDRVHREFRGIVEALEGRFEENPPGSFLESGTGVNTVILVIARPR